MKVWKSITAGLSSVASVARTILGRHPSDPNTAKMLGIGGSTKSGVEMNHYRALAIPAVFRAVSIISSAMLKVPFYVFEDDGESKTHDRSHPSWTVINRKANRHLLAPTFRETMTAWALLWGNAVAYIDESDPSNIQLIPLLPDRTNCVRVSQAFADKHELEAGAIYFNTVINGKPHSFEASRCLHIRGLGMNPYWGEDVVTLLSESLGGAAAAAEYGHLFYGQGGSPAGFVEMPGGLDEPAAKRFTESIRRATAGLGKAHKVAVLEEGSKFHPWQIDPEKAQFLEGKEFDIRTLAMIVGIKVAKLIDSANSSYNSLEMSNQEHKEDDLTPWYCRWAMEYEDKLLTEDEKKKGTHSIGPDDDQMEWVPFKDRSEGVVKLYNNGLITKDEGRRRVNFGRSRTPNAKKFRIPKNIDFEGERTSVVPPPVEQDPREPKETEDEQEDAIV